MKPYYLYQCDPISGSAHFRTPVSKGVEIIRGLRGHTSGYAVPTFVVDAPDGGGKIPVAPDYTWVTTATTCYCGVTTAVSTDTRIRVRQLDRVKGCHEN